MNYRLATESDLVDLAEMRWDFRMEDGTGLAVVDRSKFVEACAKFLGQGLANHSWACWIAETNNEIISHIFVQRVKKVPKPTCLDDEYGYMTNVYTKPYYRRRRIGTGLMEKVIEWAKAQRIDTLIVWPSEKSVGFYERVGFVAQNEILEYELRTGTH